MAEEKKDSKSKILIIFLIIVIVLLAAGVGLAAVFIFNNNPDSPVDTLSTQAVVAEQKSNDNPLVLDYDSSAVALDEDTLAKRFAEMQEKAKNGYVNLEFQNTAFSSDGINFTCHFANSASNTEDMFVNIYKDVTLTEQIYLSGLMAPGTVIEKFVSEIKLEPGEYSAAILFTTVADDHQTMTSQTPVEITLSVG